MPWSPRFRARKGAITLSIIMTIPFTLSTGEAFLSATTLSSWHRASSCCTLLLAELHGAAACAKGAG